MFEMPQVNLIHPSNCYITTKATHLGSITRWQTELDHDLLTKNVPIVQIAQRHQLNGESCIPMIKMSITVSSDEVDASRLSDRSFDE
jgi:hypothetical protein